MKEKIHLVNKLKKKVLSQEMATIIRHTDANQFLFRKKKFFSFFCWIQKQQKTLSELFFSAQIGKI